VLLTLYSLFYFRLVYNDEYEADLVERKTLFLNEFENIARNVAFAHNEQMLHFSQYFQ